MSADHAWRALEQVNGWIRFADAKATALLSAGGVLGGWILATLPADWHADLDFLPVVTLVAALVAVAFSMAFALGSLKPNLRRRSAGSLLHFAHAARRYGGDQADFVWTCAALFAEDDRLLKEICDQLGINSVVADRKFRLINAALAAFVVGLALTATANLIKVV